MVTFRWPAPADLRWPLTSSAQKALANLRCPDRDCRRGRSSSGERTMSECPMCRGAAADAELDRIEVWQDAHWRLTVSLSSEVAGFAYLEPKRHIRYITELDGPEAASFGP